MKLVGRFVDLVDVGGLDREIPALRFAPAGMTREGRFGRDDNVEKPWLDLRMRGDLAGEIRGQRSEKPQRWLLDRPQKAAVIFPGTARAW